MTMEKARTTIRCAETEPDDAADCDGGMVHLDFSSPNAYHTQYNDVPRLLPELQKRKCSPERCYYTNCENRCNPKCGTARFVHCRGARSGPAIRPTRRHDFVTLRQVQTHLLWFGGFSTPCLTRPGMIRRWGITITATDLTPQGGPSRRTIPSGDIENPLDRLFL